MSSLFDDVSRIVASPIPRRQALKLLSGAVGGAVLTSLGLGRASRVLGAPGSGGQVDDSGGCGKGRFKCGTKCCHQDEQCCPNKRCCKKSHKCCGDRCCSSVQACCGNKCCDPGFVCCPGNICKKRKASGNSCLA
jgi:hypothetical protein